MPVDSKNVFRPPVDCSMCRDVQDVDVLNHISPEQFASTYQIFSLFKIIYSLSKDLSFSKLCLLLLLLCSYAYSGRPVIISDALVNWTAKDTFSYNFFRSLYKTSSSRHSRRCQFFPYKTEFRSLEEALSMSNERFTSQPW